jgi:hypothetical protein
MTLVEVLVAVVIGAVLLAPVGVGLVQALTVIPESSARTRAATDRAGALLAFSDDVAQAQWVADGPGTGASPSGDWMVECPSSTLTDTVLHVALRDSVFTPAQWHVRDYALRSTEIADGSASVELVVKRGTSNGIFGMYAAASGPPEVLLRGTCATGSELASVTITQVIVGLGNHKEVTMAVTLAETPRADRETIPFHGSLRIES